jgi:hypothetical protein
MLFLLGLGWYAYTFFAEGRFTNMSALLFTTSITIFMMSLISEQICQMRFERRGGERIRLTAEPDRSKPASRGPTPFRPTDLPE